MKYGKERKKRRRERERRKRRDETNSLPIPRKDSHCPRRQQRLSLMLTPTSAVKYFNSPYPGL
jgi:hypothetical protein